MKLNFEEMQKAIMAGGFPITLLEFEGRIKKYLQTKMAGKTGHRVRIVLE